MKSIVTMFLICCSLLSVGNSAESADRVDYMRDIKPLLMSRCSACHGALKQEASLRLDASQLIRKGGDSGAVFVSGQAGKSLLIERVTADVDSRMPPEGTGKPLTKAEVALLSAWIDQGVNAPETEDVPEDPRQHWSYQPAVKPAVPKVKNRGWVLNPIDAFVARQHEKRNLQPQPRANKATLLRRVYLDLIGLPPTREQLQEFLNDSSPQAYEKVVNSLLESPQYGQRWGRHWMDVWRYSDWYGSRGINEIRYSQRHIWRWRDWIVDSLNEDKGYDRMIVEMLAADEVAPTDPNTLRATGFMGRNWYKFDRNVWMRELVEHTAMGFMAVTMKCARCHDHKFDPIEQTEYYRFRAFFEPHDFRTDRLSASAGLEKDATLGMVLKEGVSRVFDKELDVPTYLFERGDDRYPDKENPLAPGVPVALGLGKTEVEIAAVSLPAEAYFPALRPDLVNESIVNAKAEVQKSELAIQEAEKSVLIAKQKLAEFNSKGSLDDESKTTETSSASFLAEDFAKQRPEFWKPLTGKWEFKEGYVRQGIAGSWLTMMTANDHPKNFRARVRYVTTQPGNINSVGIGFDAVERRDWQAIYTHTKNGKSAVQAFHRKDGKESYPTAAIVPTPISLDKEVVLDFAVRDSKLNVWIDGELKIAYTMPLPRQAGKFALWTHSGTANFHEVRIDELAPSFQLANSSSEKIKSPFTKPTKADFEKNLVAAEFAVTIAEKKQATAQLELVSLEARIAADRARIAESKNLDALSKAAAKAERAAKVSKADLAYTEAERELVLATASADPTAKTPAKVVTDAKAKLATAKKTLDAAIAATKRGDGGYTQLGTVYPKESTGRRLALAKWIANAQNPRTARVAVNHVWKRHFGAAIVPSVSDFGTRAKPRSHPELLDWLAVGFTENNWSMKWLHRMIVMSNTYRLSSAPGEAESHESLTDPKNVYLWRMNWQRMEAEVVRDSVFHLAGELDTTPGGPELLESQGQVIKRRSMYFRSTPNEQMEFLSLFDLANPDECYDRKKSVVPQQALALTNSAIALSNARLIARQLEEKLKQGSQTTSDEIFIAAAFEHILNRIPTKEELTRCETFLKNHASLLENVKKFQAFPATSANRVAASSDPKLRARENLIHVLFNHNDFVTIR